GPRLVHQFLEGLLAYRGYAEPLPDYGAVYNDANYYPDGGFTAYPGEAGTGLTVVSNYSPINYLMPPTASAQEVLNHLRAMGIPLVNPPPNFLGVNPRAAEGVIRPGPRPKVIPARDKAPEKQ